MRSLSAAVLAALAAGTAVLATFVRIDFPSGTKGLNSTNWNFTYGGVTYLGAAGLGAISAITDQPSELPGMQFELQNVDTATIALALDDADEVQGSLVTVSTAFIDSSTYQVLDVVPDWIGYADKMPLMEDGETATVAITAECKGVDLLRGNPLVYSQADQESLVAGDKYFQYVVSQSDQAVIWPTRQWFFT